MSILLPAPEFDYDYSTVTVPLLNHNHYAYTGHTTDESRILNRAKKIGLNCVKSAKKQEKTFAGFSKPKKVNVIEVVVDEALYVTESLTMDFNLREMIRRCIYDDESSFTITYV